MKAEGLLGKMPTVATHVNALSVFKSVLDGWRHGLRGKGKGTEELENAFLALLRDMANRNPLDSSSAEALQSLARFQPQTPGASARLGNLPWKGSVSFGNDSAWLVAKIPRVLTLFKHLKKSERIPRFNQTHW